MSDVSLRSIDTNDDIAEDLNQAAPVNLEIFDESQGCHDTILTNIITLSQRREHQILKKIYSRRCLYKRFQCVIPLGYLENSKSPTVLRGERQHDCGVL